MYLSSFGILQQFLFRTLMKHKIKPRFVFLDILKFSRLEISKTPAKQSMKKPMKKPKSVTKNNRMGTDLYSFKKKKKRQFLLNLVIDRCYLDASRVDVIQ